MDNNHNISNTLKIFNNIDTGKVLKNISEPSNNEIDTSESPQNNNKSNNNIKAWHSWLYFFSSYNVLSVLNLYKNDTNKTIDKTRFRQLSIYGLLLKLNRTIFTLGSLLILSGVGIPALLSISKNKNALDFITQQKFSISVLAISALLFISLITSLALKIHFSSILRKRELKLQYKVGNENTHTATTTFSVNGDDNNNLEVKRTFNSNSNEDQNNSKTIIPLHKTGLFSESGSYNFFYTTGIISTLLISLVCVGNILSEKSVKFAEKTNHVFENSHLMAYALLGIVGGLAIAYFTRKFAEPIFELFKIILETVWKGIKFVGEQISHYAQKAWDTITMADFEEFKTNELVENK